MCEEAWNRQLPPVYNLRPPCVRLDSTTASGHRSLSGEGLFQFGHRNRPDLPQEQPWESAHIVASFRYSPDRQ